MGFGESITSAFNKYVVFSGRARRSEYWWFTLFLILANLVAAVIDGAAFGMAEGGPIGLIFALGVLLPSLAVAVRRLHDTNRSGWWLLIGLLPLIGVIVLIVFFVQRGTAGQNRFGADPLGGADAAYSPVQ